MRRILLLFLCLLVIFTTVDAAIETEIITTSTAWVVPDGVYFISIQMSGGGGSGGGGGVYYTVNCSTLAPEFGFAFAGRGGLPGEAASYSNIAVYPGQTIDITVGSGGSAVPGVLYEAPYADDSDFTYPTPPLYRGGYTSVTINGTVYTVDGGYPGNITLSSPGCGDLPAFVSANNPISIGLEGLNPIIQYAGNGQNGGNLSMPYWSGSQGGYGYGAGGGGGGQGSIGIFTEGGAGGHGALGAVLITYTLDQYYSSIQYNTPHNVKFTVRDVWGNPVSGVTINATYEEASGPWDWLLAWVGVLRNPRVDARNITLSGHTGTDGAISFLMTESIQYNVSAKKDGTIDQYMLIYPKDDEYLIRVGGGINQSILYGSGCPNPLDIIQVSVSAPKINSTFGFINVTYFDKINGTITSTVNITQSNTYGNVTDETVIFSFTSTDQNYTVAFNMTNPADQSYLIHVNASTENCGIVYRDYGATFPPNPRTFGIPEVLLGFVAIGFIIYVGLQLTRTQPGVAAILICAAGWVSLISGWWYLQVDVIVMGSALSGFTVLAIIYNVALRSKKLPMQ